MTKPKVVGIILAYRTASYLEKVWRGLPPGVFDEVIVVDDGSDDGIELVAERLGVACFTHPHMGYGGNIKFGLQRAMERGADYAVEIHGDGQYDVTTMGRGVAKAKEGYDLVMGSRFMDWRQALRDRMPLVRFVANIILSSLARLVTRTPLTEFHNGFRVYSRRLVATVNLTATSDDYLFGFEVIAQAIFVGLRVAEVPIRGLYAQKHTSISLPKSAKYAGQMTGTLLKFFAARWGFRVKLFNHDNIQK